MEKQFNIVKPGTNEVVMGPVGPDNCYMTAYPYAGYKRVCELEVGEHTEVMYSLSGSKGTYWIVRIS